MRFLRQTWICYFCCSSGPSSRPTNWSAVSTTNVTEEKLVIESHSPSHSTLTFHSHNHAVKSIILKTFKLLQNDPDTVRVLSQLPLTSFNRDKKIGNFLVRSAFQASDQPGTFKCANVSSVVPRVFVPYRACWLDKTSDSQKIHSRGGFDWLFKNDANGRN